jgi:hypothetical protein
MIVATTPPRERKARIKRQQALTIVVVVASFFRAFEFTTLSSFSWSCRFTTDGKVTRHAPCHCDDTPINTTELKES